MSQHISAFATRLSHHAPDLIEALLALHLTGNPLPLFTALFLKEPHHD